MTETTQETLVCSFCGALKSPQLPLIAGNDGHICPPCIKLAHQVVSSWGRQIVTETTESRTPAAIKDFLDQYIIGQDEAKRALAVAVFNHYLRLSFRNQENSTLTLAEYDQGVELEKSNILLVGPSGTGKTLMVKTLARITGVPFVVGDATTLTQAGYVGEDVDTLLKRLLEAAEGNVEAAQWGIVYIDEIDKLARRGGGGSSVRDVSGEGVQQALLKMVEGSEFRISRGGRREGGEEVVLDTSHILFIVGGAFPGLTDLISQRVRPSTASIGFNATLTDESKVTTTQLLGAMQPDDLLQFGLIPEFIGRFPVVTFLEELDVESLKRILVEPRNALTKQYRKLFAWQNVDFECTDEALTHIAEQAVSRGTGARGLRAMMESLLLPTMFELPSTTELVGCRVVMDQDADGNAFLKVERTLDKSRTTATPDRMSVEPAAGHPGMSAQA